MRISVVVISILILFNTAPACHADEVIGKVLIVGDATVEMETPFNAKAFEGTAATRAGFDGIAEDFLEHFTEQGYPFAQICIENLEQDSAGLIDVTLRAVAGPLSRFDTCVVSGVDARTAEYLRRISDIEPGEPFSSRSIEATKQIFRSHRFLNVDDSVELLFRDDYSVCVPVIRVMRLPTNLVEGNLGYQPAYGNQEAYVRGFARLEFENLLGRGRRFSMEYNKKDPYSHEIGMGYFQPFVFYRPLSLAIDIGQQEYDSLYYRISTGVTIGYGQGRDVSVRVTGGWNRYTPKGSVFRGVYHSRRWTWGVGSTLRTESNETSQRFDLDVSYGIKRQYTFAGSVPERSRVSDTRLEGRYEVYSRLIKAIHQRWALFGAAIVTDEKDIPPSDLHKLGGLKNLRGYREDQFFCVRYLAGTIQPGLELAAGAEFHLFSDGAWLRQPSGESLVRFGFGGGLEFTLPTGTLVMNLAWGKGDSFGDGKFYAILESRF